MATKGYNFKVKTQDNILHESEENGIVPLCLECIDKYEKKHTNQRFKTFLTPWNDLNDGAKCQLCGESIY